MPKTGWKNLNGIFHIVAQCISVSWLSYINYLYLMLNLLQFITEKLIPKCDWFDTHEDEMTWFSRHGHVTTVTVQGPWLTPSLWFTFSGTEAGTKEGLSKRCRVSDATLCARQCECVWTLLSSNSLTVEMYLSMKRCTGWSIFLFHKLELLYILYIVWVPLKFT